MGNSQKKANLDTSDETRSFQERIDEVRSLVEENIRYTKSLKQSGNTSDIKDQQDLHKLLEENLRISKELYSMTTKIKKWIAWQRTFSVIKILIIAIPIVLASIYLPPLLGKVIQPYRELLDFSSNSKDLINPSLMEQFNDTLQGN